MTWRHDADWSRDYLLAVKRILGEYLIAEAPAEEDRQRNTDLIVLNLASVRVACRIRRGCYAATYGDEFTIRTGRPNGVKTELLKLMEGWGDYLFYGFAHEDGEDLSAWLLGDLRVFRGWLFRRMNETGGKVPGRLRSNTDGSSDFCAFRLDDMPPGFIVARKRLETAEAAIPF